MTNWTPNPGRKPRTGDAPLKIRWANGIESKWTFSAGQLRWSKTGDDWDVGEVARA